GVDWRRRKNSEHKITEKTNGLSYRLYAFRFFPSPLPARRASRPEGRFYKPEALHLPQIRLNPRDLRLNFSVVAGLRWVICYFSRQGAKKRNQLRYRKFVGLTIRPAISFPNLGALASLRETSAMLSERDSFTRGRQGARKKEK